MGEKQKRRLPQRHATRSATPLVILALPHLLPRSRIHCYSCSFPAIIESGMCVVTLARKSVKFSLASLMKPVRLLHSHRKPRARIHTTQQRHVAKCLLRVLPETASQLRHSRRATPTLACQTNTFCACDFFSPLHELFFLLAAAV